MVIPEEQKTAFQPTSKQGVSFPKDDRTPLITVNFGRPAEVQSVMIPRDKTPDANVQQFEVTFYAPNGKKINDQPIKSTTSPTDETNKPAHLGFTQIPSNTQVSRLEITITKTTNGESPKGVILDIKACTETSTGKHFPPVKKDVYISFLKYCSHNKSDINNNCWNRFNWSYFNIIYLSNWIIQWFDCLYIVDWYSGLNKYNERITVHHCFYYGYHYKEMRRNASSR